MPTPTSPEQERWLSRKEAARFLTDRGFQTAPATLAKRACVGGGPPFRSFGRKPLYREADLLEWAEARTTGLRRSTSDPGRQSLSDTASIVRQAIREARAVAAAKNVR